MLTDGIRWNLFHANGDDLTKISDLDLTTVDEPGARLTAWLETILATQQKVAPTPQEIERRLGARSPAHALDSAMLTDLYFATADRPDVKIKRELWSRLLRTALGTNFEDTEDLFIDHTLLVLYSEIIAHAVLGVSVGPQSSLDARELVLGQEFRNAQIYGVVQADFFDWVLSAPGGEAAIDALIRRITQFDWNDVQHDVLKVLYESIIEQAERKRLGEYYTPDWLADRVVARTVDDPLNQRVLDPSCGSGTFLFHAIRAHINAAETSGMSSGTAAMSATSHVFGVDVHPVAVALARVTYLLAIGAERLQHEDREEITIPVYLGDSLQWEQRANELSYADELRISVTGADLAEAGSAMLWNELVFPASILEDASTFDRLVMALADKAEEQSNEEPKKAIKYILDRFGLDGKDANVVISTFETLRSLQGNSTEPIWGYYIRSLVRPLWLAQPANRVDRIVGNPPWLRYGEMTPAMQQRYVALGKAHHILGGLGATARDLSTLFVVRAVDLYLRTDGKFAFVMPQGTLTRKPHEKFRSGIWNTNNAALTAQFTRPWDLSNAATGFPNVSCVIFGSAADKPAVAMPRTALAWTTPKEPSDISWELMEPTVTTAESSLMVTDSASDASASAYKRRFRNGAQLQPRMLLFVTKESGGPLGAGAGRVKVSSFRSNLEKEPWSTLPSIREVVEKAFVRPVFLGESVVPFQTLPPRSAVLPIAIDGKRLLTSDEIPAYSGLSKWWAAAEALRDANKKKNDTDTLLDRIDYHKQFTAQLPAVGRRVVYSKSGATVVAAVIEDTQAIIEGALYWAPVSSKAEARYLMAVLNSRALLKLVAGYQATGLFGARHIDKNLFNAPIPLFDAANANHKTLAVEGEKAAKIAEQAVAKVGNDAGFKRLRSAVSKALAEDGVLDRIDAAVTLLMPPV